MGQFNMKKEKIINRDGSLYGYEILSKNPQLITPENDFYNALTLVGALNGEVGKIHVNILPETLYFYAENLEEMSRSRPGLVFELVETDMDVRHLKEILQQKPRIKVSIDDFGMRYSNFDRVFELPNVESVKIDRLLWNDPKRERLTRTLVQEFQKEGLIVIAEKVETEEEYKRLVDIGFDAFQGYLWREDR
ncbi:EAL domain-containing protein [Persephonella sp.]